jgi:urease gamma subunit/urease beta subunit
MRIAQAGVVAQRRLARGCRLNHPEAVALIAAQMLEMIRDGEPVANLMTVGQQLLGRRQVMPGVASMIHEVQVEGTFPDGTKLLTVHSPISAVDGDLSLALKSSVLPVPELSVFGDLGDVDMAPGACVYADDPIELNAGRKLIELSVVNSGDRPIQVGTRSTAPRTSHARTVCGFATTHTQRPAASHERARNAAPARQTSVYAHTTYARTRRARAGTSQVGSHYHFIETNAALVFDRGASYGMRLNVPAGSSVRFEPGDSKTITLTEIAGNKRVLSGNRLVDGYATEARKEEVMARVVAGGFGHVPATPAPGKPFMLTRAEYGAMFGPTTGDKIKLGDTELLAQVEADYTVYGDECKVPCAAPAASGCAVPSAPAARS